MKNQNQIIQKGVLQKVQNFLLSSKSFSKVQIQFLLFLPNFISKCHHLHPLHTGLLFTLPCESIFFFQEQFQTLSFQYKLTNSFLLLSIFLRSLLGQLTKTQCFPSPQKKVCENIQLIFSPPYSHSQIFMQLFWTKDILRL